MSPPEVWGPAVWTLFHTLAEKVTDQAYPFIKSQLFGQIKRICGFLPCPECSSDATNFLAKVNIDDLKTKVDFRNTFYLFHNMVNAKKRKPLFNYSHIASYNNYGIVPVINNFVAKYNTKGNMKLLAESFQRKMVLGEFKSWFTKTIRAFTPPQNVPSPISLLIDESVSVSEDHTIERCCGSVVSIKEPIVTEEIITTEEIVITDEIASQNPITEEVTSEATAVEEVTSEATAIEEVVSEETVVEEVVSEANPVVEEVVSEENPVEQEVVSEENPVEQEIVSEANPVEEEVVSEANPVEEEVVSEETVVEEEVVSESIAIEEEVVSESIAIEEVTSEETVVEEVVSEETVTEEVTVTEE